VNPLRWTAPLSARLQDPQFNTAHIRDKWQYSGQGTLAVITVNAELQVLTGTCKNAEVRNAWVKLSDSDVHRILSCCKLLLCGAHLVSRVGNLQASLSDLSPFLLMDVFFSTDQGTHCLRTGEKRCDWPPLGLATTGEKRCDLLIGQALAWWRTSNVCCRLARSRAQPIIWAERELRYLC
jgi:hypothetical protein